jgi:hypothetical protein
MNGLEIFIIPLIALAVWVLQYIFRGPEENKTGNRSRPSGQTRPANRPPPQRRPVTDLDRYLEETRRRRQQDEPRPVIIAEVVPEAAPRVEPERRRLSVPPRAPAPRPTPRVEQRPPRVPPPEPSRRVPLQSEVVRPVLLDSVPVVVPVPAPSPPVPPRDPEPNLRTQAPPEAIDTRSRARRRADASALLIELTRLFRTREGMAAALVLQEVLGRPISQRRR